MASNVSLLCYDSAMTKILYKTCEGCERCTTDPYVPHYNCICGKRKPHCTADSCY
jgi:hypothetical protein